MGGREGGREGQQYGVGDGLSGPDLPQLEVARVLLHGLANVGVCQGGSTHVYMHVCRGVMSAGV